MKNVVFKEAHSAINIHDFNDTEVCIIHSLSNNSIDNQLDAIVKKELAEKEYINIIIPLSFGYALSDYLGLRLALHIRTTNSINQNKNIFIYGTESLKNLLHYSLFSVLSLKGIEVIDYNLLTIQKSLNTDRVHLKKDEISQDLKKINLAIPTNFYDSHSVANIWGMYRLLEIEGINKDEIFLSQESILNSVYIKWLLAKNKISEEAIKEAKTDTKTYRHKIKINPVLYKIDI